MKRKITKNIDKTTVLVTGKENKQLKIEVNKQILEQSNNK